MAAGVVGSMVASRVLGALRGRIGRSLKKLPTLVPPLEFACRIQPIPEGSATLDNEIYRE